MSAPAVERVNDADLLALLLDAVELGSHNGPRGVVATFDQVRSMLSLLPLSAEAIESLAFVAVNIACLNADRPQTVLAAVESMRLRLHWAQVTS